VLLTTALGGCFSVANYNVKMRNQLVGRASFDLNCPQNQINAVVLGTSNEWVTSYGVTGCGHRASYVLSDSEWVANVTDGRAASSEDPPATAPAAEAP